MKRVTFLFLVLAAALACGSAAAATLTVYSASSAWQSVASSAGTTYVLPAVIPGCGAENEPACEPAGIFYLNQTWAGLPSYISFTEATGGLSDIVTFDSLGPNGMFRVMFFSDPSLPDPSFYAGYVEYASLTEDSVNGAVGGPYSVCCIDSPNFLSVVVASDGEAPFDPFGAGFDTSDGIQFQGAVNGGTIPEPATLSLVLMGAGALICLRKRMVR